MRLTPDPDLHRLTLRFRDAALEARYRDAEGTRSLRILRGVMVAGAITLVTLGWVVDRYAPVQLRGNMALTPVLLANSLVVLAMLAISFAATVQRHSQAAVVAFCVLYGAGIGFGLRDLPVEYMTNRGFMFAVLHSFIVYTLLRLRFVPATVAGLLSMLGYGIAVVSAGLLDQDALARHLFWLLQANAWGMAICYQLDRTSRREFLARAALAREQARSEALLLNILPAPIAARLKDSSEPIAEAREGVTVLFADLVGFTPLAARKTPAELVALLDRVFTRFDTLARENGLEKIKTIGDAYMAAAGLPQEQPDHAQRAARTALAMTDAVRELAQETGEPLAVRVGLHSGPVVAGVIGTSKFSYDLWGDTVNLASRMESTGVAGQVHCTASTAAALADAFALQPRGPVEVKGKGTLQTFLVQRR